MNQVLPRILLVDDERHVLDALRRNLRTEFSVETATSGAEALAIVREEGPFAVVMSDYQMPQMNGAAFLAATRDLAPETTRMLLTGQADLTGAAAVVNEGGVFRMLIKPAPADLVSRALHEGVEQHRLVTAEKELLERTLHNSVKALVETLSIASPTAFARATRRRRLAAMMLSAAGIDAPWHVDLAVMLSQIGLVSVPPDVLARLETGAEVAPHEREMLERVSDLAVQILDPIPRLEDVTTAIRRQGEPFDGAALPLGACVLRIVGDYDELFTAGVDPIVTMRDRRGVYDPALLRALAQSLEAASHDDVQHVLLSLLRVGMVLAEDVYTMSGVKLASSGTEVSPSVREQLRNFALMGAGIREPLAVLSER